MTSDRSTHSARRVRSACRAVAAIAFLGLLASPADAQRRVAPDSLRQIQDVQPMYGPPGTEVEIFTENLPLQAKVHLGIGATRTGFEALIEAEQGMWGEVGGTITIPETAPWDRAVLLVAFDAIFAPIGSTVSTSTIHSTNVPSYGDSTSVVALSVSMT